MSPLLSSPALVRVIADQQGRPAVLIWRHRREPVTVCNHWRLEGDWWRRRYARDYYRLLTRSGSVCTVYQDGGDGAWYLMKTLD